MREEANASNRARVGRGWIRRACLPCRRARGHLGRDRLGRTRRRRDRRHVGGCGRGRVVAGHDLTGRPRGARHRHAALAGRPKIAGPRGRESGELAADPDATAARAASGDVGTECIRARCASALDCALRRTHGRGDARRSRADRARRGEAAPTVRRLARAATVDQRSRIGDRPTRHVRARRGRPARRTHRGRGLVCHTGILRSGVHRRGPLCRRWRALPDECRSCCGSGVRPRGDQFADVDCTRRRTHRARSTRATTGSLRVRRARPRRSVAPGLRCSRSSRPIPTSP